MMTWDTFCDQVKTTAGKAADKINQTADLATLQVKLALAERKLTDAYAELGRVAYLHFSESEHIAGEITTAMENVEAAIGVVEDYKAEIEKTKKGE